MGTSTNRLGPKPTVNLLPDWIDEEMPEDDQGEENPSDSDETNSDDNEENKEEDCPANPFLQSQQGFKTAVKTGDYSGLQRVVKNYVSQAAGGAKNATRRMSRSGKAVASFGAILNDIRQNGLEDTLTRLNLQDFTDKPALQVLSGLMDHVCGTSALLDDTVTRHAYAVTITRILNENPQLSLENLTEPQICEMMAVFLEESIVYRLVCDIGRSLTTATSSPQRAIEVEEQLYQMVNGLIHSRIVPELQGKLADRSSLNRAVQKIYRIAFNAIENS